MAIELWGAGTTRTLRPIWVAEELGISYELHAIGPRTGETKTDAFTRLNPKQKIPVMVHNSLTLSESPAICRYLIGQFGPGDLWQPGNAAETAQEDEWCSYIYGEIDETSLYVMRRHRDLFEIYGEAPAAVESSAAYALRHLEVVAQRLGDRGSLMPGFGLADILLQTCLIWANAYGITLPDALARYSEQIGKRDAYQRAMQANFGER